MRMASIENVERFISTLPYYEARDIYINGSKVDNYKAICYYGTNKPVAIVSKKYHLVQHKTVFDIVINKLKEREDPNNIKGWVEHTNTKAYFFITFKNIEIENDSNYNCGLTVTNSVNTELSIWLNLFNYRVICSNGLIQKNNILQIQNKHIGFSDFWDRFKERLERVLDIFDDYLKKEFTFFEQLKTITLDPSMILKELDMSIKASLIIRKQLKSTDTLFNLYQAITNYYTNTTSLNISNRVRQIRKARELIENYVRRVA